MDSTTPFQPWATNDSGKSVKSEREFVDDGKLHRENVNHPKHTQTASYEQECVGSPNVAPGPSSAPGPGADPTRAKESNMDQSKISSMQQIVENTLSQESRQRVSQLTEAVEALSGPERLLLYLRLPTGVPTHDPLKQPINPLGSRAELQQTVTWIQTHLEVDPDVSLPKQDVYDEYIAHCMSSNMKPLSTADFGKVMKQVYPSVRPRRLGTRGNSRYCYAGLRKKVKLEVPQLPDLGHSSKETHIESREAERIVCDWAEVKLGAKFASLRDLSRHLTLDRALAPQASPPSLGHSTADEQGSRHLLKQLKRKIQTQGTPGRPKKNKVQEVSVESPPTTSFAGQTAAGTVKHESEPEPEPEAYYPAYMGVYEPRPAYYPPARSHPPPPPAPDYRDPYAFEYTADPHLPINLSSDARPPPEPRRRADPPPARLPLPGKKLILEAYHSETRAADPPPAPPPAPVQYLPKKMRASESFGGKLAAARLAEPRLSEPRVVETRPTEAGPSTVPAPPNPARPDPSFLEDPKNVTRRSTSTAAALAREQRQAAARARSPDSCCLDGVSLRTGMICEEKHAEILNRERVISICNIDKHDLDDYLNEGSSQEHEEELLQYFQRRDANADRPPPPDSSADFLEVGPDPPDDHSQGKNEKLSQLRELLAKNLKNSSGSSSQSQEPLPPLAPAPDQQPKVPNSEGAFKPVIAGGTAEVIVAQTSVSQKTVTKNGSSVPTENGIYANGNDHITNQALTNIGPSQMYNGNCHNVPQSPTTRTQQYDFVPISDSCHSPGNFHSKSPLGFGQRGNSPTKLNKAVVVGGSLQTSPISHSTAASPFVSPRNTPVPRSRLCSRPIPKHNGRKRRNPLSLGVVDPCSKQFAIPNDQKFVKTTGPAIQYCQPMSAPPSPNILNSQYKAQMFTCNAGIPNGINNLRLNFLPPFSEHGNGELSQPLSADPLSSEVSQFFQESLMTYRGEHDTFRSQSVPLKQGINNIGLMSYNNTPVGSVPPTPVPNEFCDFGSLADTCDLSKAGLNPETLNKIYHAIDSSNDVLSSNNAPNVLNSNETLSNGCDPLPEQQLLTDEQLNSLIPSDGELLDRSSQFNQSFADDGTTGENVDDFLKRANSIEFDLSDLVTEKNKYNTSRSVPSTPLPYKRAVPNLQIDSRRTRVLFPDNFPSMANGILSKSVPSTPQLVEERSVFSYSNRDFLINGNSVDVCNASHMHGSLVDNNQGLTSPLHDMLREEILDPLTPAADLLADLDKIDGTPYVDL